MGGWLGGWLGGRLDKVMLGVQMVGFVSWLVYFVCTYILLNPTIHLYDVVINVILTINTLFA